MYVTREGKRNLLLEEEFKYQGTRRQINVSICLFLFAQREGGPRWGQKRCISFFLIKKIFFGCIGSSLLCRLSLVVVSGGYSSLRCMGFSLRWLLLLQSMGSRRAGFSSCSTRAQQLQHAGHRAHGFQQLQHVGPLVAEHGLSSCSARAQLLHGMWDLPGAGIEPVCPALAGGFLTTVPPGKSQRCISFWPQELKAQTS